MRDFKCEVCGHVWEQIQHSEDLTPMHCGSRTVVIYTTAPGIHYKRRYSHALGRRVSSYREEERELAKDGSWIASKTEANDAAQNDVFDADVTVRRNTEEKLRKHVEAAARRAVADGTLSFRQ
jgi:hypothetical protein